MRVTTVRCVVTAKVLILTVVVGVKLIGTFALSRTRILKDDLTVGQTLARIYRQQCRRDQEAGD